MRDLEPAHDPLIPCAGHCGKDLQPGTARRLAAEIAEPRLYCTPCAIEELLRRVAAVIRGEKKQS